MSGNVDAKQFLELPEELRWEVLRHLDLTSAAQMAETNSSFRDTVREMFKHRTEVAQMEVATEVQQNNATAMDLQPRFEAIFGDELSRPFWETAVMNEEPRIMDNIEKRLYERGYEDDPDGQLWSAIRDMHLLRPERAEDWLKKFEKLPQEERLAMLDAEQEPRWSFAPSVTYPEIVSAVREMWKSRGDFFAEVENDFIPRHLPVDDASYQRRLATEEEEPGSILRAWAVGEIIIDSNPVRE